MGPGILMSYQNIMPLFFTFGVATALAPSLFASSLRHPCQDFFHPPGVNVFSAPHSDSRYHARGHTVRIETLDLSQEARLFAMEEIKTIEDLRLAAFAIALSQPATEIFFQKLTYSYVYLSKSQKTLSMERLFTIFRELYNYDWRSMAVKIDKQEAHVLPQEKDLWGISLKNTIANSQPLLHFLSTSQSRGGGLDAIYRLIDHNFVFIHPKTFEIISSKKITETALAKAQIGATNPTNTEEEKLIFLLKNLLATTQNAAAVDKFLAQSPPLVISLSQSEKTPLTQPRPSAARLRTFLNLVDRVWKAHLKISDQPKETPFDYSAIAERSFVPYRQRGTTQTSKLQDFHRNIFDQDVVSAEIVSHLNRLMGIYQESESGPDSVRLVNLPRNFDSNSMGRFHFENLAHIVDKDPDFKYFLSPFTSDSKTKETAKRILLRDDPSFLGIEDGTTLTRQQYLSKIARRLAEANTNLSPNELDKYFDPDSSTYDPLIIILICARYAKPHSFAAISNEAWLTLGFNTPPRQHIILNQIPEKWPTQDNELVFPDITKKFLDYADRSKKFPDRLKSFLDDWYIESGLIFFNSSKTYNPFLGTTAIDDYREIAKRNFFEFYLGRTILPFVSLNDLTDNLKKAFLKGGKDRFDTFLDSYLSQLNSQPQDDRQPAMFRGIDSYPWILIDDRLYYYKYLSLTQHHPQDDHSPLVTVEFAGRVIFSLTRAQVDNRRKVDKSQAPSTTKPIDTRLYELIYGKEEPTKETPDDDEAQPPVAQNLDRLDTKLSATAQMRFIYERIGNSKPSFLKISNFMKTILDLEGNEVKLSAVLIAYAHALSEREGREINGPEALTIFAKEELDKRIHSRNELSYLLADLNLTVLIEIFADQPELFFAAIGKYAPDNNLDLSRVVENFSDLRGAATPLGYGQKDGATQIRNEFVKIRLAAKVQNQVGEEQFLIRLSRKDFDKDPQKLIATLELEKSHITNLENLSPEVRDHYLSVYQKTIDHFKKAHEFAVLGLRTPVFPYQREGVEFMLDNKRIILADEAGLGKTLQAIGAIETLRSLGQLKGTALWTTTLTNIPRTIREIFTHTDIPPEKILVLSRNSKERSAQLEKYFANPEAYHFVINHFEGARALHRSHPEVYDQFLKSVRAYVIDEAQYTDNPKSQRSQAILSDGPEYVFMLTATPYQSDSRRLFTLLHYLRPDRFPTQRHFEESFPKTVEGARKLVLATADAILRRNKEETVTTLDPKLPAIPQFMDGGSKIATHVERESMPFHLSDEQTLEIAEILENSRAWAHKINAKKVLESPIDVSQINPLSTMIWIRNVIYRPKLLGLDDSSVVQAVERLRDKIRLINATGKKSIVWAYNRDVIDLLKEKLAEFNPVLLQGGEDSGQAVHKFQEERNVRLLIGNYAMAVGADISMAAEAFHFQTPTIYPLDYQVINRHHRIISPLKINDAHLEVGTTRILPLYKKEALAKISNASIRERMREAGTIVEQDRRRVLGGRLFYAALMSGYMQSSEEYGHYLHTQLLEKVATDAISED